MAVLIIAKSADESHSLRTLLEYLGQADVVTAASTDEALQIVGAAKYDGASGHQRMDAVLLDVDVPDLDTLETCRQLKEARPLQDVPLLILTEDSAEQAWQKVLAANAFDYVRKPIQHPELLARLRAALLIKGGLDSCRAREQELVSLAQQLKEANQSLKRLSVLDELTGIANYRCFDMVLAREWGHAARAVLPLSLLLVNLDFFQDYNAHYGHDQGDDCLCRIASELTTQARRPGDFMARTGGDEFAALLAHTGNHGAANVAEKMRQQLEILRLPHAKSPVCGYVTISVGVASIVPERRGSPQTLVQLAQRALREAKHEGRNRVKVYPGLLDTAGTWARGPHRAATGVKA